MSNILYKISNFFLTFSVYLYKLSKPKKEKHIHNILVLPPRFFDFGAEENNRNSQLKKCTKFLKQVEKDSDICYNQTF